MSATCFYCGEGLKWSGDDDAEDVYGIEGVLSYYVCPRCKAEYEVTKYSDEEQNENEEDNKH